MSTVPMKVCDICGDAALDASTYSIEEGGRRATIDLCAKDAAPIEQMLTRFQIGKPRQVARTRSTESYEALIAGSIEEVEAARRPKG